MSERTREKLVCMGKFLHVYFPSRDDSGALTDTILIHLVGHNETGGSELYQMEIVAAFYPSVAIEFESRFLLKRLVDELPTSAFSFDYDRAANVVAEICDAKAHDTIYTLGSGPLNERLRPQSNVVSKEEKGVEMSYVVVHCRQGPTFIRKLSAVPGQHRDQLVPATFAETCYICQPYKKRAQLEYQSYLQVETQSRQELDLRPTGPPRVKLPRQEVTPPVLDRQPDTGPQIKRKRDVHLSNTTESKHIDCDREEARMKLMEANEAPMSKPKCDNLPASLHGPEPLHDDCNDRNKKRKVLENSLPPMRKRENSLGNIIRLQPSHYGNKDVNKLPMFDDIKDEKFSNRLVGRKPSYDGSKDTYKKPKFAEKEVLTSEECAELARDFLTELEESLNS
ncbi:MAG: hypothetical protein ASARMPRED_002487 [Alectoria sarmentosa]|nr:MAG: hypothetical protein ASARMPRED_002487 [Alectoria sarmentosa]